MRLENGAIYFLIWKSTKISKRSAQSKLCCNSKYKLVVMLCQEVCGNNVQKNLPNISVVDGRCSFTFNMNNFKCSFSFYHAIKQKHPLFTSNPIIDAGWWWQAGAQTPSSIPSGLSLSPFRSCPRRDAAGWFSSASTLRALRYDISSASRRK